MMGITQGGINPGGKADGFAPIPLERTSVTGPKHVAGVASMARGAADTATSDFSILLNDQPSLDFGGKRFDAARVGQRSGVSSAEWPSCGRLSSNRQRARVWNRQSRSSARIA